MSPFRRSLIVGFTMLLVLMVLLILLILLMLILLMLLVLILLMLIRLILLMWLILLILLELLLHSGADRRLELPTVFFDHDTRLHHETGARQQEHLALGMSRELSDVDPNAIDFEQSGLSRSAQEVRCHRFIL